MTTLFCAGYIETWGRGIERITTVCKNAGKREPLFEVSSSEIKVTFFSDIGIGKSSDKSSDKVRVKLANDLVKEKIMAIMQNSPKISAKSIADMLEMSPRGVEKNISEMKVSGLIKRIGPRKGGHWVVLGP